MPHPPSQRRCPSWFPHGLGSSLHAGGGALSVCPGCARAALGRSGMVTSLIPQPLSLLIQPRSSHIPLHSREHALQSNRVPSRHHMVLTPRGKVLQEARRKERSLPPEDKTGPRGLGWGISLGHPQTPKFIYENCVSILICLNFSHLQSSLHLMQYIYQDVFYTAQNSF